MTQPLTVLIVDDLDINRKLLGAILEAEGHQIAEAADGVEALAILEKADIDAIISDILMPRMDGYRFCHEVRASERFRHLPFIFYTSTYISESDEKLALEMGSDKFLAKPAPASKIIATLNEVACSPRTSFAPSIVPAEPVQDLNLMKEYNQQLVTKLEHKNNELTVRNAELLRSEQDRLLQSTALETAANAVVITDTEGVILWVNTAFATLTGYSAGEAVGKTPRLLKSGQHSEDFYKNLWQTVLAGKTWRGSFTNRRKDGSFYHDEHTITPVFSKEGVLTHFVAIMNDVTERRLAERKLRESEERLDTVTQKMTEGLVLAGLDGKLLQWNPAAMEMHGFVESEGRDQLAQFADIFEIFSPDGRILPVGEWPFMRVLRDEPVHNLEVRLRRIGSDWERILSYSGAIVREPSGTQIAFLTTTDITDRKRAEERIAEQAAFLDKARDAILVRDLKGNILFWNKGAERVYGWTAEEVSGRYIGTLLYAKPEQFEEFNALVISQGEWSGEIQHLTKDKHMLAVEGRWTLVRDNAGNPKSILAINTDITDKKKIEAQFMRAQRMESIGTLAGGIAHDLNNILAPIMMSIDLLKATVNNPKAQSFLDTIEVSAKRGADIVRQVLSFARGLEGERIEIQPKHLLKDLEQIVRNTFPKDIQFRFEIPNNIWTILGDPTQVHQILLNLCVNARDAMPNGGTLSTSVENCVLDEQYAAMNIQARAGRYVKISVTDSGTGMPPELIDKIFEPFFTTKELNKGTGLGLSTVMAIVKSHEGTINVYSEQGQGTTFRIYLPAAEASSDGRREQPDQSGLPRGNGETVLIVDDEASILNITGQTLQAFGYQILTATDGAEAVAVYAQHRNEIAVVLTDMMMPVMDGPSTIHALMRIDPGIKIIAASGLNANGGVAKVSGAGVKHFLTKPYTAATLLRKLRLILDEK